MTKPRKRIAAIAAAAAAIMAAGTMPGGTSLASTFVAWSVTGVAAGDLLNVRAYPSSVSRILVGYPNGTTLSMTGRCTGGLDLHEIAGAPRSRQRRMARYAWCEAWLDPEGDGAYRNGWVYGRYLRPD